MTQPQPTPDSLPVSESESFETSLAALEKIVHSLEDGQQGLSQSLEQYERGIQHLKRCSQLLDAAEAKIELLTGVDASGQAVTAPFDCEQGELAEKAGTRQRKRRE
jgi:exodeoxyribonuclease VII small subunit